MREFYIKHMIQAHESKAWLDRKNYAQMAGLDFVKYFYFGDGFGCLLEGVK